MARFPYFGFPFQYPYYRYYNNYSNFNNFPNQDLKNQIDIKQNTEEESSSVQAKSSTYDTRKTSSKNSQFFPFSFDFNGFSNSDNPIIEILGIKLYLDDIIILCLLFLLYKEGIKDEMLFIALILLLLS